MLKRRKDEGNTSWFAGVVSSSLVLHRATRIAYSEKVSEWHSTIYVTF